MGGVSGIGSYDSNIYGNIASGSRINTAADDAAGLAIAQKMESQDRGLTQGASNASEGQNVINIADGALSQVTDSLQRIYELSIKASNTFMYGDEERSAMQKEVSGLLQGIEDIASRTNYNEKNLLDGSTGDMNVATGADGSGSRISMPNATVKALGLDGYDLTKDFDITKVSDAIKSISGSRVSLGAQSAALAYTKNYNELAAENTLTSQSKLEDLDIGKAVSEKKKKELLDSYMLMMQKKRQEEEEQKAQRMFQF